jgi:alkanesulfonate monooxygenase SsuD/methylene tetrahydromethanopterin reductase-like flavin-dependent oxidoreductase (luciferase family)
VELHPAPGPALALAAALAELRAGTWVYASPFRPPRVTAREAHSLSVLTDGRFEMGVGAGRPGIEDELRERGLPVVPPGERLAQVRETVRALRDPRRHRPSRAGGDGRTRPEGPRHWRPTS